MIIVTPGVIVHTAFGMQGKDPDAMAREVSAAYALGKLPKMEGVAFGYMWSAHQHLGAEAGSWRPHMMVYTPYYDNSMLGGNEIGGRRPSSSTTPARRSPSPSSPFMGMRQSG